MNKYQLDKVLKTTKNYIDTGLNGKANSSHTHSYLPLTGGTITGKTTINTNSGSSPLVIARNTSPAESTEIYQDDSNLIFKIKNDEKIVNVKFDMTATDIEDSDGSGVDGAITFSW